MATTMPQYSVNDRSGTVLNRYYDSLSDMVAGIVRSENISDEELDELEGLIQRLRRDRDAER